jgi:hypothetical protein
MDVLPAIPSSERRPTGILLTDTTLGQWQKSNPKTYGEWFFERMKVIRDIHFKTAPDNRPVSIILTTLAALAYRNQPNVYDALLDIARDMTKHIERRNDKWWVANPAEPDENFADRWNQ